MSPIFTPRERRAVLFLSLLFLVGTGVRFYQRSSREGAPLDLGEMVPADSATIARLIATSRELADAEREPAVSFPIDLNTASARELTALPGVGPVLAERIVEYRRQHGDFTSVEGLTAVRGIGEVRLREIAPLLAPGP